jgi:hypothetical protein
MIHFFQFAVMSNIFCYIETVYFTLKNISFIQYILELTNHTHIQESKKINN